MFEFLNSVLMDIYAQFSSPQKRLFFGYLISAALVAFLWLMLAEKLNFKSSAKRIFDSRIWFSRSGIADIKLLVINRFIFVFIKPALLTQLAVATVIYHSLHKQPFVSIAALADTPGNLVIALFSISYFLVDDFSRFFLHRLMHKFPALWAYHKVHHSAETLTPFTIFRTHPIEGLFFGIRSAIVQGILISTFLYIFGNNVDLFTIFGVNAAVVIFHSLGSNLRHSHIKIRYPYWIECIFISPAQHQIHHSVEERHYDRNFGVALAVWDWMFGSLHYSEGAEHKFGLEKSDSIANHNLTSLYLRPICESFNSIKIFSQLLQDRAMPKMKIRSNSALIAFLLFASLVGGILIPGQKALSAEINIYSHRQKFLIEPFLKEFSDRTGTKVNVVYASKGLAQRLQSEGEASPADVVLTVDIGRLKIYSDKGLFQPVNSKLLNSSIPAHLRSQDGTWFGFSKRSRVIAISTERVTANSIKRIEDLAKPEWKGRICTRPGSHVYNRALLSSIIAANGEKEAEKWATAFVSNLARRPQGNDRAQLKAISVGQCDVAIINHYYFGKLVNSEDADQREWVKDVSIIFPNQEEGDRGAHVNISGGGIAKYSQNVDEAVKFLEFLVSPEAQSLYANINYEYPVIGGIALPETLTKWGEFKEDTVPIETIADLSPKTQMIIDRTRW